MKIILAGGVQASDRQGFFNISKRNDMAVRKMFHRNDMFIDYRDLGGNVNRTVGLAVKYGEITMKVSGRGEKKYA
jgi:chemotaxis protein CheD